MRLSLYRTSASPRRQLPRRNWVKRGLIVITAAGVCLGGLAGWLWRDALLVEAIDASAQAGLRLERIEIDGRLNTDKAAIMKTAGISWYDPMLTLDLGDIHQRLMSIGWVGEARVERRLPNTLIITLNERQALALFQDKDGHHVIDRSGEVINNVAPEGFTHLPVIKGQKAPQNAQQILTILKKEPELFAEVWSLSYQSERRWDVFLRNNIRIQLPEMDPNKAWSKLAEMDRAHKLTNRDVINIDLRIPGKLVIRPTRTNPKGSST